jgi:endonuclease/exonuclease/phosphatase family metal-dependent hydrolase
MNQIESGSYLNSPCVRVWSDSITVVSWNINRGLQLDGIIEFLRAAPADLILLQEADVNAFRTGRRNIPREIARALRMNYVFGREFEELAQGTPTSPAYHGQTTLSRLPLSNPRMIRFRDQSSFWLPRWFIPPLPFMQRRLGGRMALISEVSLQGRTLTVYNLHLESRGSDELRMRQFLDILADVEERTAETPVLIAGDFNFDLSRGPAVPLVAGTGMKNPFTLLGRRRMALGHGKAAAIDWMLTKGAVSACDPAIHDSVAASDHFPLSLELRLL